MIDFRVRFTQDGSTWMILDKEDALKASDMARLEVKMIQTTKIPQFIPLNMHELDLQIQLRYNISGKRMLSQCLRSEKLSLTTYYSLLMQLVTILDESRRYMLRPEQYILHTDYMFVEGSLDMGSLWLCYAPTQMVVQTEPLQQRLSRMMTLFMASVTELTGKGIQQLIHYCHEDHFSLQGLKSLLLQLLSNEEGGAGGTGSQGLQRQEHVSRTQRPLAIPQDEFVPMSVPVQSKGNAQQESSGGNYNYGLISTDREQEQVDVTPSMQAVSSKHTIYIIGGALLAIVLLWKFLYSAYASVQGMFYITVGITVLIGDAAFLAWRGYRPSWLFKGRHTIAAVESGMRSSEELTAKSPPWNAADDDASGLLFQAPAFTADRLTSGLRAAGKEARGLTNWLQPEDHRSHATNTVFPPTNQSVHQEATVMLNGGQTEILVAAGTSQQPILERIMPGSGEKERIPVNQNHFVIGRSGDVAHYLDTSTGVSRSHAEIIRTVDGYQLKDLGSKNGTRLLEEPMVPYTPYPLNDGDRFLIAQSEYVFRLT